MTDTESRSNAAALAAYDAKIIAQRKLVSKKRRRNNTGFKKAIRNPDPMPDSIEALKPCAKSIAAHIERARILRAGAENTKILMKVFFLCILAVKQFFCIMVEGFFRIAGRETLARYTFSS
jgi:hypothetical protein